MKKAQVLAALSKDGEVYLRDKRKDQFYLLHNIEKNMCVMTVYQLKHWGTYYPTGPKRIPKKKLHDMRVMKKETISKLKISTQPYYDDCFGWGEEDG